MGDEEKRHVVVVDCDMCLLARHAFGEGVTPDQVAAMSEDEFQSWWPDLEALKTSLYRANPLRAAIYVASYGCKPVITAFLERAGLASFIDGVITPSDFPVCEDGHLMPGRKNAMLAKVITLHPGIEEIRFYDDDMPNLEEAACLFASDRVLCFHAAPLTTLDAVYLEV